jgi:hypothetical protein
MDNVQIKCSNNDDRGLPPHKNIEQQSSLLRITIIPALITKHGKQTTSFILICFINKDVADETQYGSDHLLSGLSRYLLNLQRCVYQICVKVQPNKAKILSQIGNKCSSSKYGLHKTKHTNMARNQPTPVNKSQYRCRCKQ